MEVRIVFTSMHVTIPSSPRACLSCSGEVFIEAGKIIAGEKKAPRATGSRGQKKKMPGA
jgi:hypothetical protein